MTANFRLSLKSHLLVVVGLLLALLVWMALPGSTLAHAEFLRSNPESGTSLSSAPSRVDIWFSEKVAPGVSSIQLFDADRRPVETNGSTVDPNDAHHLSVDLPSLPVFTPLSGPTFPRMTDTRQRGASPLRSWRRRDHPFRPPCLPR